MRYSCIVEAVPMTDEAYGKLKGITGAYSPKNPKDGYKVTIGLISYETWFSKEVFDKHFTSVQEEPISFNDITGD